MHSTQASEQHQQASADFARAARSTSDGEALRVLKLLEDQHRRLADIVKTQDNPQQEPAQEDAKPTTPETKAQNEAVTSPPTEKATTGKGKQTLASTRIGSQIRDSSPSLARDIASRRGIPQPGRTQPSAAAQARTRQLSPESRRRAQPKVPPSIVESQANLQTAKKSKKFEDDEGFAKFYNNLTTGTMSKISSALAYAGLPLTAEDSRPDESSKPQSSRRTVSASNDPDVKRIFSKAALDAIEDDHRERGTFGHGFGATESFYVVQQTGGTVSYADITKAQQQHMGEDEEPEFVDAKEAPGPPSPLQGRFTHQQRGSFGSPRTQEELELENTTLKNTLEQITGRLAAFEAHAQDASMAAVTQSMANLRPEPSSGASQSDAALQERLRQLEKQVEQQTEDRQKLEAHAAKLEKMNRKWKARWDDVSSRAKERTKAKREPDGKAPDEGGGDGVAGE